VVAVFALVFGLLLDAPGLHKSAFNQSAGWQRSVALAVAGPLADTSHALYLDRPRSWLKAGLGRSADDTIDTRIVLPTRSSVASRPAPGAGASAVKRRAFTPASPLRLWVAGDSLVIAPGESLERAIGGNRAV